jgi:NAD(P)-dependent dehydrogenase (short-subunit alcohol dehydrogenase family)
MELSEKHVVVTGAARGIGAALARRFHAAGARVVLADRDGLATAHDPLRGAAEVIADIRTEAGVVSLIEAARSAFGPIDLFFANAGVGHGGDPMSSEEVWEESMAINFHSHRWAARHLLPDWLERGEGYFCSTASAAGLLAQIGSAPYSVSKHAAVAFAEWLAITYGGRGLRVSCLCPQGVNTAMLQPTGDNPGASGQTGFASSAGADIVRAAGAILEPDEVAAVTIEAIEAERFLILPHAEVASYMGARATDHERWLAGMRKLQQRVTGV